jgi:hypothetical protein
MKRFIIIPLLLITVSGFSQSFFHKRMKKVNKSESEYRCEAVQIKKTFAHSLTQRLSYQQKRAEYRRKPKNKKPVT